MPYTDEQKRALYAQGKGHLVEKYHNRGGKVGEKIVANRSRMQAIYRQEGGDVELYQPSGIGRLYGTVDAPHPVYGARSDYVGEVERGYEEGAVERLRENAILGDQSAQQALTALAAEGRAEDLSPQQKYERDYGPEGYTPTVFQGRPGDRQGESLFSDPPVPSVTGTILGGVADYQLGLQQQHVDAGTGLTLSSPSGFPVTVHPSAFGNGLVVTGNTEGVPHKVYVDQALRQGLAVPEGYGQGILRTGTDALGLTQPVQENGIDPELPGGSFGGPGGFAGADGVVYDTAAEATRSLDRADAARAAAEAAAAREAAERRAQATRDAQAQAEAEAARERDRQAQEEAKRQAAAYVHRDSDGQGHNISAGRQAVTDRHGNAVTDSRGNAVTSRNSGGGGGGGGGGSGGGK